MRCPKCHYISFDSGERCRNCGFEFSLLAPAPDTVDLPLRGDETPPRGASTPVPAPGSHASARLVPGFGTDLPLFEEAVPGVDDTPLITTPSTPRPPLAVRRSTEPSRPRPAAARAREPSLAFPDTDRPPITPRSLDPAGGRLSVRAPRTASAATARAPEAGFDSDAAPIARRLAAGVLDGALILGIDALVVLLTLRLTGLEWAQASRIPLLPFVGFLVVLNGGYVVAFTATAGQTFGKMLAGIRVVAEESVRVPLGQAVLRTAAQAISVLPLCLGCLPMFFDRERRTVHDRLSNTRVVRA